MYVPQGEGAGGVPTELLEVLSFPYVEGVIFVRHQWQQGGIAAIDDLFRRPPRHGTGHSSSTRRARLPCVAGAVGRGTTRFQAVRCATKTRWRVRDPRLAGMFLSSDSATKAAVGWAGTASDSSSPRRPPHPGAPRVRLRWTTVCGRAARRRNAVPRPMSGWARPRAGWSGRPSGIPRRETTPRAGPARPRSSSRWRSRPCGRASDRRRPRGTPTRRRPDCKRRSGGRDPPPRPLAEIPDPTAVVGRQATIVEDESGRRMWVGDGDDAVAAGRIDGLRSTW